MTISQIINNPNLTYHHTATRKEYVSRKVPGIVRPYKGRFGEGYIILHPRWDTTTYCYVDYYITTN